MGEGSGLLPVEGRVGESIYGDDSEGRAGGGAEGGRNKAAREMTERFVKGNAGVLDESGASRFLVGGVKGPEG